MKSHPTVSVFWCLKSRCVLLLYCCFISHYFLWNPSLAISLFVSVATNWLRRLPSCDGHMEYIALHILWVHTPLSMVLFLCISDCGRSAESTGLPSSSGRPPLVRAWCLCVSLCLSNGFINKEIICFKSQSIFLESCCWLLGHKSVFSYTTKVARAFCCRAVCRLLYFKV